MRAAEPAKNSSYTVQFLSDALKSDMAPYKPYTGTPTAAALAEDSIKADFLKLIGMSEAEAFGPAGRCKLWGGSLHLYFDDARKAQDVFDRMAATVQQDEHAKKEVKESIINRVRMTVRDVKMEAAYISAPQARRQMILIPYASLETFLGKWLHFNVGKNGFDRVVRDIAAFQRAIESRTENKIKIVQKDPKHNEITERTGEQVRKMPYEQCVSSKSFVSAVARLYNTESTHAALQDNLKQAFTSFLIPPAQDGYKVSDLTKGIKFPYKYLEDAWLTPEEVIALAAKLNITAKLPELLKLVREEWQKQVLADMSRNWGDKNAAEREFYVKRLVRSCITENGLDEALLLNARNLIQHSVNIGEAKQPQPLTYHRDLQEAILSGSNQLQTVAGLEKLFVRILPGISIPPQFRVEKARESAAVTPFVINYPLLATVLASPYSSEQVIEKNIMDIANLLQISAAYDVRGINYFLNLSEQIAKELPKLAEPGAEKDIKAFLESPKVQEFLKKQETELLLTFRNDVGIFYADKKNSVLKAALQVTLEERLVAKSSPAQQRHVDAFSFDMPLGQALQGRGDGGPWAQRASNGGGKSQGV